jgi:hypothetical protein
MNIHKTYVALGLIVALSLFLGLVAHADESDQTTVISFSKPVEIPGRLLPAGTYVFKLLDSDSDLHIVQVFNADRTFLYATLQTIATDRATPTAHTAIALAQQGSGQPDALLKWFYPERTTGNEFVYPKGQETQLARDKQETIVANEPEAPTASIAANGD